MNIVSCDHSHRIAWNAYVASDPVASLYHLYEWREVNQSCFGHRSAYLAALNAGEIAGIFPIVQVKSHLFGNIACSLPFVNFGGPAARDASTVAALIEAAERVADEWGVDYLEIRTPRRLEGLPTSEHKVSMTVALPSDPEALFNGFKRDHRKEIRHAYKEGFAVRFGGVDLIDPFYDVLSETWRDLGTPIYEKRYLAAVLQTFPHNTVVTVVNAGDEPAAVALVGFYNGVAEGLWLGVRSKYRSRYVGYVLYWELLKWGCGRGLSHFHLGRSTTASGAEAFKRKWNAEPLQLYWQYVLRTRADIPQLNVANAKYRLAIDMWRKLPVPVTQVVGPYIARSIP
jgi:FemAB-related protein (PEP-CTERM system-associated)